MKLCRLQLSAFGPFTDHVLDFGDPARAGIHLVYGPNEAGKSSSLRAITGLFFGIPVHTDDAHLHPMKKLRVGATLALSGGEQLEIVRRKGRTRTLLDPEGNAIDEAVLQRALGGASRELFLSMFGLDHRTLRDGAEALLAGGGDVGETLFDAGGARGVHEVLAGLRTEADELFRPRGQTQKLNKAISAFKEARQRVRLRTVSGEAFHTQKQLLDEAEQERMDLQAQRQQLTAEQSELQRALAVLPHGAKRRELRERREAIGTVATLDGDTAERRVAAQRALDQGERDFQRVEAERDALEERRAELSSMPDLVAVDESVIAGIQDRLGSYRQAAADRPRLEGRLREMEQGVTAVLRELDSDLDNDEIEKLRIDAATAARIDELAQAHGAEVAAFEHADTALQQRRDKMNKAERALGGLEQVPSADDLAAALAGARRAGDLDEAVAQAQQEQKGLAAAVAERARALGVDAEDRARWRAAPSTQLVAELEARLQQHADRGRRLSDRKADLEQARVALDRDRATLRQGGDVPTEEQLGKARHDRDSAWKQLGAGPIADESAKDFERLVRGADALADRLRREADRVAKDARLAADDEANQQLLRQVDDALAACQADGAVLEAEWTASWSGVGVTPGSPVSMRDWLSLHAELMAESARADASQQQCELLVDRRASHLDELARALAACGDEAVVDEPLPPKEHRRAFGLVVDAAERRCAVLDERARERASLRAAIDEALSECSTLERRRAATERKLDKWRSSWAACMRKIRLPGDASIEQARAVVTITQRLFDQAASAQQMRGRIDGIERDAMQFASDVRLLLDQHLSEQVDLDAEPGAELLLRRYNTAKNDASQAERIAQQLLSCAEQLTEHRAIAVAARGDLAELMRRACVDDVAALVQAESDVARARELDEQIAAVEEALFEAGEGKSLGELEALAADVNVDRVKTRLRAVGDEVEQLNQAIEGCSHDIGTHRLTLQRHFEEHEGASQSADDAEAELASIGRHARRFAVLRMAITLLSREIERYRQENQGPVLRRASELFPRLTLERYRELRVDFSDADAAELRCVRADGRDLSIAELSDGTRDQLYLALRLASLERYAVRSEPVPLVFDDILIHFDDERATAALQVIDELSSTFQVLFFTHHARLLELARSALGGRLREHVLSPRPLRAAGGASTVSVGGAVT